MSIAIKIAIGAAVYALFLIFFLLWWASLFRWKGKSGDTCTYCGDPCNGEFCSETHELLSYDEDDLAWEEIIYEEDE